jgi:hypothetical protein
MNMDPHGFCLLMHEREAEQQGLYRLLLDVGFAPWDRNGLPLFTVLESHGSKQQWFEAGFLAGARVPLFLVGTGAKFRQRHIETIGRLGGWAASIEGKDLVNQIGRRGIKPTAWDAANRAAFLEKLLAGKEFATVDGR